MSDELLMIFIRNPELGKVKTRLSQHIGKENALTIYTKLLEITRDCCLQVLCDKQLHYSDFIPQHGDSWPIEYFRKKVQSKGDLGERMYRAFESAFDHGYRKVLIIGSDCYSLKPDYLKQAFELLESFPVVIGPAEDGGYYLLGLCSMKKELFLNKTWGTARVFHETINDLKESEYFLLPSLNDIDTFEDLSRVPDLLHLISKI